MFVDVEGGEAALEALRAYLLSGETGHLVATALPFKEYTGRRRATHPERVLVVEIRTGCAQALRDLLSTLDWRDTDRHGAWAARVLPQPKSVLPPASRRVAQADLCTGGPQAIVQAIALAAALGAEDKEHHRRPRGGAEIVKALGIRRWRQGHEGYLRSAYTAVRWHLEVQAKEARPAGAARETAPPAGDPQEDT